VFGHHLDKVGAVKNNHPVIILRVDVKLHIPVCLAQVCKGLNEDTFRDVDVLVGINIEGIFFFIYLRILQAPQILPSDILAVVLIQLGIGFHLKVQKKGFKVHF
jgi:hypothetical protein